MRTKEQGFSLIEVMITFLLIGVSVLGLIKLQAYIEQKADFALHSVEALNLAEQKLEWFRTRGFYPVILLLLSLPMTLISFLARNKLETSIR